MFMEQNYNFLRIRLHVFAINSKMDVVEVNQFWFYCYYDSAQKLRNGDQYYFLDFKYAHRPLTQHPFLLEIPNT